ncbi:SCO2400 family protein [Streptomyces sp. NBC_01451]|uniref:SCO2400 family protein n=1 Tax=Streptomyces sp. NBC_01451 TaxID=2903872 RepID=UPI002E36D6F2|nr:hypothetical protein [Streptomyces sp. NBC_01451]
MDYCSTCCRHLNGALVCPGCGAYAPDIAPLADGTPAPATAVDATPRQVPVHLWNDPDAGAESDGRTPQEHPYDDPDVPSSPAPNGRAARRRQRERWKKTQRRALVATAVALVGGGMTVSSMSRQTPDRTQAASAPDRVPMGIAEDQVTEPTPVPSTPGDTYRAGHPSSAVRSATTNSPHEQAAVTPRATPVGQVVHQKSVTVPLSAVTGSTESQAGSTVSDATADNTTQATDSPTTSATDSTSTSGTDTSSATPSPSESSSTSSSSSSSSELCLLGVLCIS